MNYRRIYDQLIKKRQKKVLNKPDYYETHHIIPRCLGGSNKKSNLVRLTAREHFIAHYLLAKIHGGRLWVPVYLMSKDGSNSAKGHITKGRLYETARIKHIEWMKAEFSGEGGPFFGKKHSKESRDKISKNRPRVYGKDNPLYGYKFGDHFGWVISMIASYKPRPFVLDFSLVDIIHKSVGLTCKWDESKKKHVRIKTKELRKLGCYFRGLNMGYAASKRDNTGSNNPNYGNDKVKGDCNGRYRPEIYLWKHKYQKEKWLTCTCYEAYTKHGMSKPGVIDAINLNRSGTRNWIFMGYADKEKEPSEVTNFLMVREAMQKPVECPHCGKVGRKNSPGMVRYHFDNCRKNKYEQS